MADDRFGRRGKAKARSREPADEPRREAPGAGSPRRSGMLPKVLVVLAIALMAAGLALGVLAGGEPSPARDQPPDRAGQSESPGAGLGPAGFLPDAGRPASGEPGAHPGEGAATAEAPDAPANPWSPALFRVGFSFFIGFAIAFALRSFIKLTLVAVGFFAMALLGMQYAGFLEVNWTLIGERYDTLGGWISGQFDSFQSFIAGELPAAASALAGLAFGFRAR